MAKILAWIFVVSLLVVYFGGGDYQSGHAIGLLVLLSVLTLSESIEKIGRK